MEQVKAAVCEALCAAGMQARGEFEMARLTQTEAAVVVGIEQTESRDVGFTSYLGEEYDEKRGCYVQRYARRMEIVLSLEVYAPRNGSGSEAERAAEQAMEILREKLPSGVKISKVVWEKLAWDEGHDRFCRRGLLYGKALLMSEQAETDESPILDFKLKGVILE